MNFRTWAVLCIGITLAACNSAPPVRPAKDRPLPSGPDLSAYRLGIGDRVRVDVFGEPDLSLEATVDPTGRIGYPLLGSIEAHRKTARDLQNTITQGLAGSYLVNPDVRITVVQYRAFYVTGQVHRAGAYPYIAGLTVEKALALAGGMTNLASTRRIYLMHEDGTINQRVRVGLDAPVMPGDTLLVEESLF
ncbi:MAG TPA: polysaccharide biosynthesis/export family protein [Verrucomicrobiae bacterium]|nr:polysaccharide biosynthesis/export family protein [Verrucomicrobiae bacterium]